MTPIEDHLHITVALEPMMPERKAIIDTYSLEVQLGDRSVTFDASAMRALRAALDIWATHLAKEEF